MKNAYKTILVFAIPAIFLIFTSEVLYHTGSPGGKTGSPGDGGHNCTDCHAGTAIQSDLLIYSPELLSSGYAPGQTYDMFVVGYDPDAAKYGFEATAEDGNNNKTGTFTAGVGGLNQTILNGSAITHTALGITPIADTGTVWMFQWTAPTESAGDITFYTAVNAVNGNGNINGDQVYTSNFMVSPQTGLAENSKKLSWSVYPNPGNGVVSFNNTSEGQSEILTIVNLAGQTVWSQQIDSQTQSLDLNNLEKGVYFIRFGNGTQRFIID